MIGAGDCPYCGGDVVFDLHGDGEREDDAPREGRLRETLRRLRGR